MIRANYSRVLTFLLALIAAGALSGVAFFSGFAVPSASAQTATAPAAPAGAVWAWGNNGVGQLGYVNELGRTATNCPPSGSSSSTCPFPAEANGLSGAAVKAVEAGSEVSFGVKTDGTLWSWGGGEYSLGRAGDVTTPVGQVGNLGDVTQVSAPAYESSGQHALARTGDNNVWAWGRDGSGQLGDCTSGDEDTTITPQQVGGLNNVKSVSAGSGYSVALKNDGRVYTWGDNGWGQLGDGSHGNNNPCPANVFSGGLAIAAGQSHTLVLKDDGSGRGTGTVWGWGYDAWGQLGTTPSGNGYRTSPVQVKDGQGNPLVDVRAISAGQSHGAAVKSDGTVWTWGGNEDGQLGTGGAANGLLTGNHWASQVPDSNDPTGYLTGVRAIDSGRAHMVALKSDGTLMAWGNNRYGQLGDYTAGYPDANRSTPVQVAGVSGASAIAAGDGHSLAVVADTTVPTTPSVASHTPTQTTGVPRNTKPTATFSKEMNETTINATNIKFQVYNKKKKKWISVARTVSYDSTSKTATITPGSTLLASKKYRVTVTTNVKDTSGTALDQNSTTSGNQPATWTFTTGTS